MGRGIEEGAMSGWKRVEEDTTGLFVNGTVATHYQLWGPYLLLGYRSLRCWLNIPRELLASAGVRVLGTGLWHSTGYGNGRYLERLAAGEEELWEMILEVEEALDASGNKIHVY